MLKDDEGRGSLTRSVVLSPEIACFRLVQHLRINAASARSWRREPFSEGLPQNFHPLKAVRLERPHEDTVIGHEPIEQLKSHP